MKNQSQIHQNQIISSTPASSSITNKTTPTIVEDIHLNSMNILAGSGQIQKIINLESKTSNNHPKTLFPIHPPNHNLPGNNGSNNNITTKTNTCLEEYNANTILQSFLEKSLITKNPNWKRDYKLSRQTQFNLWLDLLKSELQTNDLLDVIDLTVDKSAIFTTEQQSKRNLLARDLLINRLDRHYHNKIS